jgi:hypothetical protein
MRKSALANLFAALAVLSAVSADTLRLCCGQSIDGVFLNTETLLDFRLNQPVILPVAH